MDKGGSTEKSVPERSGAMELEEAVDESLVVSSAMLFTTNITIIFARTNSGPTNSIKRLSFSASRVGIIEIAAGIAM